MKETKENMCFLVVLGIIVAFIVLMIGFSAGSKLAESRNKQSIIGELKDGGFIVKSESGDLSAIYWEENK